MVNMRSNWRELVQMTRMWLCITTTVALTLATVVLTWYSAFSCGLLDGAESVCAESIPAHTTSTPALHAMSGVHMPPYRQQIGEVPHLHDAVFGNCSTPLEKDIRLTRELISAGLDWGGPVPTWISDVSGTTTSD